MPNVRSFNGSSDGLTLSVGSVTDLGYGTWLTVMKRNSTGYNNWLASRKTGGLSPAQFYIANSAHSDETRMGFNDGRGADTSGASQAFVNADGWAIIAYTKAAGASAVPRSHLGVLSTLVWSHVDTTPGAQDDIPGDGSGWTIGFDEQFGDYLGGSIFLVAFWNGTVLTDAQLESALSLQKVVKLAPTNLWVLDQQSETVAVTDFMGTGADQTNRSGTTVVGDTIPNFDPQRQQFRADYSRFPKVLMRR